MEDSTLILAVLGALVLVIICAYTFGMNEPPKKKKIKRKETNSYEEEDGPSKWEMTAIGKDLKESLKKLKTEYPPDSRLVTNIRGIIFSGDIKKIYAIARGGFIETATQLTKQLIEDSASDPNNFMNLIASLGAICTMDDQEFKVQAGNKVLIQTLSTAYDKVKNGTYFQPKDHNKFVGTVTMLLAGITVADEPVKPILKTSNLFELCSEAIHQPGSCISAVLFIMNASYEDIGRELLRKCTPEFWGDYVNFLAHVPAQTFPEAYEQIYLTLSNLYLHSDVAFKIQFSKTLLEANFFKLLARDIRRLQLDAIGLTMNIFQDNQLYEGVLTYELLEALAHASAHKHCAKPSMENISGVLYNLVISKKAPQALLDIGAQEPLQKLAECPDKEVADYAEVLLTKVGTLSGEVSVVERKCSSTTCDVRSDKLKKCAQCSSVWYCSKECQVNDWPTHKQVCTQLKEHDGAVPKKQANMDRTVAMKYLGEHLPEFEFLSRKQHLNLDQCVIVVDFTKPVRDKTTAYSIDKFFSQVVKKPPFSSAGEVDFPRLKNSHANCGSPAFVGIMIQSTSIGAFVLPLMMKPPPTAEAEADE